MAPPGMLAGARASRFGPFDLKAMAAIEEQVAAGYTLFCMKPSQYTDDISEVVASCRRMVDYCDRSGV